MSQASRAILVGGVVVVGTFVLVALSLRGMMAPAPGAAKSITPVARVESKEDAQARQLQRGAYLMTVMDCQACHTPHGPDGKPIPGKMLTGHPADAPLPEWDPSLLERNILATLAPTLTAFAGPFGVSIAPNLTPDKETGIGNMSAEQLMQSWRSGKHWQHDRPVLPPMPAANYAALTDDDIRALHAYLMSLDPVSNKAPESIMAPMPGGGGAH